MYKSVDKPAAVSLIADVFCVVGGGGGGGLEDTM